MVIGLILYEKSNGVPNRAEEPEHEFPAPASKKFGLVLLIQNYLFQWKPLYCYSGIDEVSRNDIWW